MQFVEELLSRFHNQHRYDSPQISDLPEIETYKVTFIQLLSYSMLFLEGDIVVGARVENIGGWGLYLYVKKTLGHWFLFSEESRVPFVFLWGGGGACRVPTQVYQALGWVWTLGFREFSDWAWI